MTLVSSALVMPQVPRAIYLAITRQLLAKRRTALLTFGSDLLMAGDWALTSFFLGNLRHRGINVHTRNKN
jgi:hypothetical protein